MKFLKYLFFIIHFSILSAEVSSLDSLLYRTTPLNQKTTLDSLSRYPATELLPYLHSRQIMVLQSVQKTFAKNVSSLDIKNLLTLIPSEDKKALFLESFYRFQKPDTLNIYIPLYEKTLLRLSRSTPNLTRACAELLRYSNSPNSVERLLELLESEETSVFISAAHSLCYRKVKKALPILKKNRVHSNPYIRYTAKTCYEKLSEKFSAD